MNTKLQKTEKQYNHQCNQDENTLDNCAKPKAKSLYHCIVKVQYIVANWYVKTKTDPYKTNTGY